MQQFFCHCLKEEIRDGGERICKHIYRLAKQGGTSPKWKKILINDPCSYCGARPAMTVDHIIPYSAGAPQAHRAHNSAAACLDCNERKGSKLLLQFLVYGGLGKSLPGAVMPPRPRVQAKNRLQRRQLQVRLNRWSRS